jgi:hypothetical protein
MIRPFFVTLTKTFRVGILARDEEELRRALDEETASELKPDWDEPYGWSYTIEDPVGTAKRSSDLPEKVEVSRSIESGATVPYVPELLREGAEENLRARRLELGGAEGTLLLPWRM